MIELSNNYVALNLAKFIYEEEAKLTPNKHQQGKHPTIPSSSNLKNAR